MSGELRTRFAPSPTGLLHIGNGYSALICQQWAEKNHAQLLLRIEDIDQTRCRPHFTDAIFRDLHWLGIRWLPEVMVQSRRLPHYRQAISRLQQRGVLYPCFCSRAEIRAQIAMGAPHHSQPHYPGTCRHLTEEQRKTRLQSEPCAWRLDIRKAAEQTGTVIVWRDNGVLQQVTTDTIDDVVLVRKDIGISYHLAVVVDDAAQHIDMVIRGEDLRPATAVQTLLQRLLDLPHPDYLHHKLVRDSSGKRLAKRDQSTTLAALAQAGVPPDSIKQQLL